jgi:hypothetical protein
MSRRKTAHPASLSEEIHVTREGDEVELEWADPGIPVVRFFVGRDRMEHLTDGELVEIWKEGGATGDARPDGSYVATEIPQGRPQIERAAGMGAWVPRGTVLRCRVEGHLESESERGFVNVDGKALSLKQFGRLLSIFEGWGMRIEFVPEKELGARPQVRVQDPKTSKGPNSRRPPGR